MSKPLVLIVDDDKDYLNLLSEALELNFTTHTADNLSMAEHLLKEMPFDIALVDENIGTEKGSDWIKIQKGRSCAAKSFVLYSGMATEEAILKGFECGADDFLAKPISLHALITKLDKLINYQHQLVSFEQEIKSRENMINISMAQASKYGACMQLTNKLNYCFSFEQIRDQVFSFLYSQGLTGCIAFYPLNEAPSFYHSENGLCSPVETEVMELLKRKSRLYTFGHRTIFNHPLVSILILNLEMGTVNTDIYIDTFAAVIESIGARMAFIAYKNSLLEVQTQIELAVAQTKRMIEVSKHHQQEVMNEIVTNIGASFHVLDMTEEQESYLTNLVHNALKKHSQDDDNFQEVCRYLDQALASVDKLKSLNSEKQFVEPQEPEDEDELF